MKFTNFTFRFKGGEITVSALNYNQGKILAQAEAIQKGWDFDILAYRAEKPKITLRDFLRNNTQVYELCVIRDGGWVKATCWIDHEDLFHIPPEFEDKEVQDDRWDEFPVMNENGTIIKIPCHYVDV